MSAWRLRWWGLGIIALGCFFGGGWLLHRGLNRLPGSAAAPIPGTQLFQQVFEHVRRHAVDSLKEAELYRLATSGVLEELDDPYAALVPEERGGDPQSFPRALGLYLDLVDGWVTVVAVTPGSPGADAGVQGGDIVVVVDQRRTAGLRPEAVAELLRGERGSKATVRVRLRREREDRSVTVALPRGPEPPLPAISAVMLGDGVGHIRVYGLSPAAVAAVRGAVEDLTARGARALALDLRGCVEGELRDAVALADLFLGKGAKILSAKGRMADTSLSYVDSLPERHPGLPLVVLTDRGSSGAAEAVAGALQDHDRALVVGETTFGRGAVLSFFPLGHGLALRLSTALWVTPSGRVIQRPARPPSTEDGSEAGAPRPEFHTDGGRTVQGGGGIVPDRQVVASAGAGGTKDEALETARTLLARATSLKALLASAGK